MKFLPSEDFYIITRLTPEQVQKRLQAEVSPDTGFNFTRLFSRSPERYFKGYVINGKFEFKPAISRTSLQIKGNIQPWINGSRVHVKMSIRSEVAIFTCCWLGGVSLFGIGFLIHGLIKGVFDFQVLPSIVMFLIVYLLMRGSFKSESETAKDKLFRILYSTLVQ